MGAAPFPVALHVVQGIAGHIGAGRATAYALGHYPYVACVDDDDWIEPNALCVVGDALAQRPRAVYTRSWSWQNGAPVKNDLRQQLRVFRREPVAAFDFAPWPACDSTALIAFMDGQPGQDAYCLERVYHGHIDPLSRARLILNGDSALRQRALALGDVHLWPEGYA
jgi:hypothetical protein